MPLTEDIDDVLDPILAYFRGPLETELSGEIAQAYLQGDAQMMTWGKTQAGIPIAYEGPPIQKAVDWAGQHGAKLVTKMAEETKQELARVISDGIKNKRGIPGLARDIRGQIGDMSTYRSQLIARTETNNALSQAFLDRGKAMGVTGKRWITAGDDRVSIDICLPNEGQGVIPFNDAFQSGDMAPPGHPNCRCALAPVMLPKKVEPVKPPTKPITKAPPTEKVSPEMKELVDKKLKVTGKKQGDIDGLSPTLREIKSANLPDSHLATVRSIEINASKVQRVRGAMAYCDGGNNIVLAGKVGKENIVHEIGHAFWNKRVFVPDKISKVKYDVLDAFAASTKTGRGFVSTYARTDVDEFFAECYAAFAKNPAALTKLNPSMGKILKGLWKL